MRPRDILANNLRALMASRPDLDTLPKITARCGVTNGTLDRIRRAVVSTRVDELERLARAFGIEPWELLRPNGHAQLSPLAHAAWPPTWIAARRRGHAHGGLRCRHRGDRRPGHATRHPADARARSDARPNRHARRTSARHSAPGSMRPVLRQRAGPA